MGDRGQVIISECGESITLYSHWSGSELPQTVAKALGSTAGRNRAQDAPYLTRIIFDTMTEGEHGGETGYGIWVGDLDSNHPDIKVSIDDQTVTIGSDSLPFAEFVAKHTVSA